MPKPKKGGQHNWLHAFVCAHKLKSVYFTTSYYIVNNLFQMVASLHNNCHLINEPIISFFWFPSLQIQHRPALKNNSCISHSPPPATPHPLHANTGCDVIGVSLHISWNWIDELMPVCDLASAALYAACHHWSVMQIHRSKFTALSGNLKVLHQTVAGASSPIYPASQPASHQTNKQTNRSEAAVMIYSTRQVSFSFDQHRHPDWHSKRTPLKRRG